MDIRDMKPYANLHLHSTHSDGVYTPAELVAIAKNEGYHALAITDHDTASAYPELVAACKKADMECIFGVEFTVIDPYDFHIVGFGFDPEYPEMRDYLEKMALRQTDNTRQCFEEAVRVGGISGITWDEVLKYNTGIPWLCNNHVFGAMKSKGLVKDSEYMAWFNKNFRHQRDMYPPSYSFKTLDEIVDLIKRAGGFAVCAHPKTEQLNRLDKLVKAGIAGLEVLHPSLTREEKERSLAICLERGFFISGGSDHSGLCGGYYDTFASREELYASNLYVEPLTVGATEEHYHEIRDRKTNR